MARRRSGRGGRRRRKNPGPKGDKPDKLYAEGVVSKALPNTVFRVETEHGTEALVTICGKMRRSWIRVLPGDRVSLELSAYDPTRGRIIFRHRPGGRPRHPA